MAQAQASDPSARDASAGPGPRPSRGPRGAASSSLRAPPTPPFRRLLPRRRRPLLRLAGTSWTASSRGSASGTLCQLAAKPGEGSGRPALGVKAPARHDQRRASRSWRPRCSSCCCAIAAARVCSQCCVGAPLAVPLQEAHQRRRRTAEGAQLQRQAPQPRSQVLLATKPVARGS